MSEMVDRVTRALKEFDGVIWEEKQDWDGLALAVIKTMRDFFQEKAHNAEFQSDNDYELFHAVSEIDEAIGPYGG